MAVVRPGFVVSVNYGALLVLVTVFSAVAAVHVYISTYCGSSVHWLKVLHWQERTARTEFVHSEGPEVDGRGRACGLGESLPSSQPRRIVHGVADMLREIHCAAL